MDKRPLICGSSYALTGTLIHILSIYRRLNFNVIYTGFMDPYQIVLNRFKLKRRSAPNSKNWHSYLIFFFFPMVYFAVDRSPAVLILTLISFITAANENYTPTLALVALVMFRIYQSNENEFNEAKGWDGNELAYFIRIKHHLSLKERLKNDPHLAYSTYQKRSLLYWCKHYNNLEAHKILLEHLQMRKVT